MNDYLLSLIDRLNHYSPILTMLATFAGVAAASVAAWNAYRAIREARLASINQNRAYLTVARPEIVNLGRSLNPLFDGSREAYGIMIWIKNTGSTPAKNFRVKYTIAAKIYSVEKEGCCTTHTHTGQTARWVGMAKDEKINFIIKDHKTFDLIARCAADNDERTNLTMECCVEYDTMFNIGTQTWTVKAAAKRDSIYDFTVQNRLHSMSTQQAPKPDPLKMSFIPVETGRNGEPA